MKNMETVVRAIIAVLLLTFISLSFASVSVAGSISGNVSYSGGRTGAIYVALSSSPVITPGVPSPQYYAVIVSPGPYTIPDVPDGTYYVGAIRTNNLTAIQAEDPYGMYGINFVSDFTADAVMVSGGAAVTGKDFLMIDGTQQYPNPFYVPPTPPNGFSITATSIGEASIGAAYDGTNYLVGIETNINGLPGNIVAQMVSSTGSKIGSLIDTGRTGIGSSIAFDGTNYLMVWEDDIGGHWNDSAYFTIYGQFISKAGAKVGSPFAISSAGIHFDGINILSYGGGKYLTTYTKLINPANGENSDNRYIAGRFIEPNGSLGSEFRISTGYGANNTMTFDGTNFFVVWVEDSQDKEVRGRSVSPAGVLGTEISINASSAPSDNPLAVAFDGTNYLVVWNDEISAGEWNIYGQLVKPNGTLTGSPITIENSAGAQMATSIAYDGLRYIAVWADMNNDADYDGICDAGEGTCWDVYGRYIGKNGVPEGAKFVINSDPGNQLGFVTGYNNGKYLIVLNSRLLIGDNGIEGGDVYGMFITPPAVTVQYQLTVIKSGTGSGDVAPDTGTLSWVGNQGTGSYASGATVTLTATPALRSSFTSWKGCTTINGNTCTVSMTAAKTVTATFTSDPKYAVKVKVKIKGIIATDLITSDLPGISCPLDCTESYWKDEVVTLTATPPADFMFSGWSGACIGTESTCTLTMTTKKSVAAAFIPYPKLIVIKAGAGAGAITSNESGINCGNVDVPDCSEVYTEPATVVLTATPALHSSFTVWKGCTTVSGNTCTVSMTAAKTVTATFAADPKYTLTTVKAGAGTGTITSAPTGINCPGDCTEPYWKNEVVTLTATPSSNAMFSGWSGSCTGTQSTCEVTMTAAKSVTATFVPSVWNIETVLSVGSVGEYPAIAVGNNGNPHISYLDYNDGYVKYAFKSGTTWTIENVEYVANTHGTLANSGLSSIALDAANNPHICYQSSLGFDPTYGTGSTNFKYARKVGASWTTTIIPMPTDPHGYGPYSPWAECSIAVDKTTGTAHVSLQGLGGWDYVLGYWKTGLVSAVIVDNLDGNSGYHNAIALDSNGFPAISYEARSAGNLKYAHWNGSAFNLETVDQMSGVYWEDRLTSLVIDKDNNPHIAYHFQSPSPLLSSYKYAHKNGSSWTTEAIPYQSGYPSLSLSLDGTGKPHLALVGGSLKHAYWNGSSWSFDTIEDHVGRSVIAVDNSGKIHIAYNTDTGGTGIIKYASK